MALSSERSRPSLAKLLAKEPWRFEFFQAIRLLESIYRETAEEKPTAVRIQVGFDGPANSEIVRFQALASHSFPPSEIHSVTGLTADELDSSDRLKSRGPCRMVVPFFGLFGPSGVLPKHYTQLVIDRTRKKDTSLKDFLDVFNHRLLSFFYRAWEKYRFAIGYERSLVDKNHGEDLFTSCLFSLAGFAPKSVRNRLEFSDRTLLYYAAHFCHRPRNAWALQAMIADFYKVATTVLQFQGQWLYLTVENQSRMSSDLDADNLNNVLGMNVIVGDRVWSVENKFRIRLGPLTYQQFRRFTPFGDTLPSLGQFVRIYVGPEYDFDIQPVLQAAEIPECRLGAGGLDPSFLGWNTWLRSGPRADDAKEPTFVSDGAPSNESRPAGDFPAGLGF